MHAFYDPDADSCFGSYSSQLWVIKNIDIERLIEAIGINDIKNLQYALDHLPKAENDIIRLKNFCDKNDIGYVFRTEEDD